MRNNPQVCFHIQHFPNPCIHVLSLIFLIYYIPFCFLQLAHPLFHFSWHCPYTVTYHIVIVIWHIAVMSLMYCDILLFSGSTSMLNIADGQKVLAQTVYSMV